MSRTICIWLCWVYIVVYVCVLFRYFLWLYSWMTGLRVIFWPYWHTQISSCMWIILVGGGLQLYPLFFPCLNLQATPNNLGIFIWFPSVLLGWGSIFLLLWGPISYLCVSPIGVLKRSCIPLIYTRGKGMSGSRWSWSVPHFLSLGVILIPPILASLAWLNSNEKISVGFHFLWGPYNQLSQGLPQFLLCSI